eukprot:TRINITY_DN1722_c0_g1_i7.p1 TRINITY_DN1722_c0_g1~~TRINITY_DN1722_c0_g1_i7.p1  ORF type:complete len:647 (+),score=166.23 TRINITY_DN1722_c0_g1_i7:80-2020(+)
MHRVVCCLLALLYGTSGCSDTHIPLTEYTVGKLFGIADCAAARATLECHRDAHFAAGYEHGEQLRQLCPVSCNVGCGRSVAPPQLEFTMATRLTSGDWTHTINVAGAQRMLTQRMSKQLFLIAEGVLLEENLALLQGAINRFDSVLGALMFGNGADLPGAPTQDVFDQMSLVRAKWLWFKQLLLQGLQLKLSDQIVREVYTRNMPLLTEANRGVSVLGEAASLLTLGLLQQLAEPGTIATSIPQNTDLAGRQRLLAQRASKEALLVGLGVEPDTNRLRLAATRDLFIESHGKLVGGDQELSLPRLSDPVILAQMATVEEEWGKLDAVLRLVVAGEPVTAEGMKIIHKESDIVLAEMNVAVGMFAAAQATDSSQYFTINWGYHEMSRWTDVSPVCGMRGLAQSPIHISTASARQQMSQSFLRFWRPRREKSTELYLYNSGQGLRVSTSSLGMTCTTSLLRSVYSVRDMVFRTPAEHVVDGVRSALEVQLLLTPADGGTSEPNLTVAALYDIDASDDNRTDELVTSINSLEGVQESLDKAAATPIVLPTTWAASLERFLSGIRNAFHYQGGQTVPPCHERTHWLVAPGQKVGRYQMNRFLETTKRAYGLHPNGAPRPLSDPPVEAGNARSLQPADARPVVRMSFFSIQ